MVIKYRLSRFISILTALAIAFSGLILFNPLTAYASSDTDKEYYDEALVEELSIIEPIKENYNLNGVDFCALYTSEKIPVYEYTNNGIVKTLQVLPVYYQDQMKLLMYEVENSKYQAVAIPKGISVDSDSLAMIYDDSGCNLYNGESVIQIFHSDLIMDSRKHLTTLSASEKEQIELADLSEKRKIKYSPQYRPGDVTLAVNFVSQPLQYGNICWAAACAMIVNYKKNMNRTAVYIAKLYYGSTNFNQPMAPSDVDDFLNDFYGLGYTFNNSSASFSQICTNIANNNPIYGSFYWYKNSSNWGYHAAVIYGYNAISNSIFIKDPQVGSVSGSMSNSKVVYYSSAAGCTMQMSKTVSKNW